jgi:hypothetical protein
MKLVLPDAVRINIVRKGRKAHLVYEEDFSNKTIVKQTSDFAQIKFPKNLKVSHRGKTIRMETTADYSCVADMICGEFFCWAKIGEMTLREILVMGAIK